MKKVFRAFLLSSAMLMTTGNGYADVATDLQNFWENSGGGVNVNKPNFYQGQRAGFATLGSVSIKTRTRNTNLANLQLPSIRAGCGGIDIFGGSFSFISREELIKLMEAIMQNASGFAFELALQSMSPAVQETVAKLRDLVQEVNAMNINSCETGQLIASSLWPKMSNATQHICKTIGSYQGFFADQVIGRHECSKGGKQTQTLNNANAETKSQVPVDINYAWEAIKKNSFLSSDRALAEFFMSLTGTIVVKAGANDSEGPIFNRHAPKAMNGEMIDALVEGGSATIYGCGANAGNKCLEVQTTTVNIPANRSLLNYTADTIYDMYDAIRNNSGSAMPAHAIELQNMTSVPIIDLLQTGMAYQYIFVQSEIDAMAEVVAVDLAMIYTDKAMQEIAAAASRIDTFGETVGEYSALIRETQAAFGDRRQIAYERFHQALSTMERLAIARKQLAGVATTNWTTSWLGNN